VAETDSYGAGDRRVAVVLAIAAYELLMRQVRRAAEWAASGRRVLSEHTVGRHLANILRKLDLSSRAAAAA
jgi:hypothetical protein